MIKYLVCYTFLFFSVPDSVLAQGSGAGLVVDPKIQQARDESRISILQAELLREREALAAAQKQHFDFRSRLLLAPSVAIPTSSELHQRNIDLLEKEIAATMPKSVQAHVPTPVQNQRTQPVVASKRHPLLDSRGQEETTKRTALPRSWDTYGRGRSPNVQNEPGPGTGNVSSAPATSTTSRWDTYSRHDE